MTLTPEQRRTRARAAAYAQHARHDPRETTRAARAAFNARFEQAVEGGDQLPLEELCRRAEALRRSYMQSLALKSSKARRRRKAA